MKFKAEKTQKKYYSQITRKIISLVLVFDLIIVSCFCYGITAQDTRAADTGTGGINIDDTWYTNGGPDAGNSAENPYIIDSTGKLLSLSLMLKNGGYGTKTVPMVMKPEIATLPALLPDFPDSTEPGIETPPEEVVPTPEPPVTEVNPPTPEIPKEPSIPAPVPELQEPVTTKKNQEPTRGIFHLDRSFDGLQIEEKTESSLQDIEPETPTNPPEETETPVAPEVPKEPETPVAPEKPNESTEPAIEAPDETTPDETTPGGTTEEGIMTLEAPELLAVNTDPVIQSGFQGKFFKLSATIDMGVFDNSTSTAGKFSLWTPIGTKTIPFNGTFTGETGTTISNFTYNNDGSTADSKKNFFYWGLFGYLGEDAVIDNLNFENVKFYVKDSNMNASGSAIGVVAAYNNGLIKNVTVKAPDHASGAGIELPNTTTKANASCFGGVVGFNSGHIMNGTFVGNIHSDGELKTGPYEGCGIGGITGVTNNSGKLINCMVKSDITFKNAGKVTDIALAESGVGNTIYVGGITGKYVGNGDVDNPSIKNAIFTGSIKAKGARSYNSIGGIVGSLDNGYILQSMVSADLWYSGSSLAEYSGGLGGIAGIGGTVDSSFVMGSIESAFYTGGIAGKNATVLNSYSTGSIKTLGAGVFDHTGGLVGANDGEQVTQSYFAGATLTPHTGSVIGITSQAYDDGITGVFYDKYLSPNSATIEAKQDWATGAGKATKELCSASFSGFSGKTVSQGAVASDTVWIVSDTNYPQLAWTKRITASAVESIVGVTQGSITVSQNYVDLVQNFSSLSTVKWLDVKAENSYGNGYQMMDGKSGISGAIPTDSLHLKGTSVISTYENKKVEDVYKTFSNNTVGELYKNQVDFNLEGITFSAITKRKTLYAPKTSTSTAITTEAELYKFLDYWQGGGAILGSKFTIESMKPSREIQNLPNYNQGIFAGTLEGKEGPVNIEGLKFASGSRSLLGDAFYATIQNIHFKDVSVGTSHAAIAINPERFGLLAGTMAGGKTSNIHVNGYGFYVDSVSDKTVYGGILGEDLGNSSIDLVVVENFKGRLGKYSQTKNTNTKIKDFGVIAGKSLGSISNCKSLDMDVVLDVYSGATNNDGAGGITGYGYQVSNCMVTGALKVKQEDSKTFLNVGGITGFTLNNGWIKESAVIANLQGMCVGGITGYTNWAGSVFDSYFTGEIDSAASKSGLPSSDCVGGIIGLQSGGGTVVKNSFAFGNITGQDQAGGLIGRSVSNCTIENSYANGVIKGSIGAGGLIGTKTATSKDEFLNSFFIGQVGGSGAKGGFVGSSPTNYKPQTVTNTMYDKQLIGRIKSLGSVSSSEDFGRLNGAITAGALNSSAFTDTNPVTNYPQITIFSTKEDGVTKKLSDASTKKIFALDQGSENEYLQGIKFTNITVDEVTEPANRGYYATVTPNALYYIEGSTKHEMMTRVPGSKKYEHVEGNTYTEQGNLAVAYKFPDLIEFSIPYMVGLKAFDYGAGTETDPYIIYNEMVFQDFAKFVSKGRDSQSMYYKIAGEPGKPNAGKPIVLNMASYPFDPIKGFSGNLIGNNSTISNTVLGTLVETVGTETTIYKGIFATANATANISDLTIKDSQVGASLEGRTFYMGGLIAYAKGGTYENILVDIKETMNIPASGRINNYVGGLIGGIDGGGGSISNLKDITTITTISGIQGNSQIGGSLVGYILEGTVHFEDIATYGKILDVKTAGGLIGKIENTNKTQEEGVTIHQSLSLVDFLYEGQDGVIGGLIGETVSPKKKNGQPGESSIGLNLKIQDSYYGGELFTSAGNLNGGIIGNAGIVVETNQEGVDTFLPDPITDEAFLGQSVDVQIKSFLENSIVNTAYAFDKTPYVSMNFDVYAHYTLYGEQRNQYPKYSGNIAENFTGKSSTWELTSGSKPYAPWLEENWSFEKGLFPILKNTEITTPEAIKESDKIKFYSIALFMTRAGKIGENKQQNVYITYNPTEAGLKPQLSIVTPGNGGLRMTTNGAMAVATGVNTAESIQLTWKGFHRVKNFTASTEASGIPDFSWYVVNPQGMWRMPEKTTITTETDASGNITTKTAISLSSGWNLHTADQLAGLSLLTEATGEKDRSRAKARALEATVIPEETMDLAIRNADLEVEDGNGVTITKEDFYIPEDSVDTIGDTTKHQLFRVMLGKDIDLEVYKNFRPIGNATMPFSYKFDGTGKVVNNLQFTASSSAITQEAIGLFGTVSSGAIENLGLMKGNLSLNHGTEPIGTLAGKISNGTLIQNCFSAMGMFGDNTKTYVGGIVGESDGSAGRNTIKNTFFTGGIQLSGDFSVAGGLVGKAKDTDFTNSYTAGYVDATTYGAIVGVSERGNNSNSNIYDKEATGEMAGAGVGSLEVASKSTTAMLTGSAMAEKAGWEFVEGYYPIQTSFTKGEKEIDFDAKDNVKAAIVPIQFKPSARSTSEGKVLSTDSALQVTTNAIYWNTTKGEVVMSTDALGYTNFSMKESGMIWTSLGINGQSRDVLFNLRCWYDDFYLDSEGHKVYTISAASELAELAAIVNGTVNINNPNGTHKHKDKENMGEFDPNYSDFFQNATIALGGSIDLSTIENWTAIGTETHLFQGTFDGQENVLFGLNQTLSMPNFGGLFGAISHATIKNVGIQGGTITATVERASDSIVGGIASKATNSKIENCFTSMTINAPKSQYTGGILGSGIGATDIIDCFVMSDITGGPYVGGIAGSIEREIAKSYHTGIVRVATDIADGIAAGIVAKIGDHASIQHCFVAGYIFGGTGGTSYGIAPDKVTASEYDKQMTGAVTGVTNADAKTTANMTRDGSYIGAAGHSNGNSQLFKGARGLSLLALDFQDRTYSNFHSGVANRKLADDTEIHMNLSTEIFRCIPVDESYVVSVEDASTGGSDNLIASIDIEKNGARYVVSKPYYLFTKPTIAIRYNFTFTKELVDKLSGSGIKKSAESNEGVVVIESNTALESLITSINNGTEVTAGKTYQLTQNINNGNFAPIGTKTNPFKGTFDGNGYSIGNATINGTGDVGFFAYIGNTGKVKNLKLENITVKGEKPNTGSLYVGAIAAHNSGAIVNVGVTGRIYAKNENFDGVTYLGGLVGENTGRVDGCYFTSMNNEIAISHSSKTTDFAGGIAGINKGSFTGCYVSSDMKNINIKGIFGSTKEGIFKNCYYNCGSGNNGTEPLALIYAYDDVPKDSVAGKKVFVPYEDMKKPAFSQMLSSNLYGGTYYQGGKAYPELYCFELMGLDFGNLELMLSVRNLVAASPGDTEVTKDSFMNALCTYKNFGFPYFSNVAFNNELQVDMPVLDREIDYSVGATIYGKEAQYTDIDSDNTKVLKIPELNNHSGKLSYYKLNTSDMTVVQTPKTIMLNVTLNPKEAEYPWGVFKKDSMGK